MRELENFETSDYLEIIRLLGYNIKPMSYSEILEKTNIPNTSLSRALKWLQNMEEKETRGKELKEAYFLKRDKYIEHNGLTKSKNSSFKLTEKGIKLFNNEFLKEYETNYLEERIKDFKINQIIWDFISRDKKLFFKDYFKDSNKTLEPWTLHLFEFFDDLDETDLIQIQASISGSPNMRFLNLLEILSEILIHHPVWEEKIIAKGFEKASLNTGVLSTIKKDSLLKEKTFIIERGDNFVCLFKSDKLIKAIYPLIQKYLKIYYWQENNLYLPKENIIQNIIDNVINELYQNYEDYDNFIDKFRLEIFYLVKQILIEDFISGINPIKIPFNLMNNELRDVINFQLKRKLLSSDSEEIPSVLLNQGASKDLIKETIDLLVEKYFQDKNNLKNNLKLLEILVYNYSMELRSDFWFYEKWKMSLQPFIQQLIDECLLWNNEYTEQVLVLGFIFYNQKFPDYRKAIEINDKLLQLYPNNDYLLENLLYLHFSIKEWNLEKINVLINKTIDIYPENILYRYSNIIIHLLNDKIKNTKELVSLINNLYNSIEDLSDFIKIIRFFSNKLDSHGFNDINLKLLKVVNTLFSDIQLKFYYAKALERNGRIIKALKIYLNILDFFPNMFLESYVLLIFINNYNRFTEKEKKKDEIEFLKKVQEFSVILMSSVEFEVNEGDIYEFEEKRAIFLKDLRTQLKSINLLIKNSVCKILPLKIKAIILKALNREKNLESTLLKILDTSPKNIWAINELGFLYFQHEKFEEGIKLFELAELIKHEINYNIPYIHIIGHSYLYEIHEFNFAELYKKAGRYNQAILIYIDYLINLNKKLPFNTTAKILTDDLVFCYEQIGLNSEAIIKEILKILDKMEYAIIIKDQEDKGIFVDRSINLQHDPVSIKNSLIEYLYRENQYRKCLEFILKFNDETPRILENIHSSILSPFNINILYLAECYLNLNDLANASKLYEQAYESFNDDIRYTSKVTPHLWFIRPVPDYLKIKQKQVNIKKIERGFKRINKILGKENILEEMIFKTDIERSIGNICLIIKKRAEIEEKLFETLQDQLKGISETDRIYYGVILASSYAITGYIDKMFKIIKTQNFEESYPIISTLMKILYYYYENDYEKFFELNIKFHQLVPNSIVPLLLNLHFLRFKKGISKINNIKNLFTTIWKFEYNTVKIYGIEKQIFTYFKNNLTWYPFKWTVERERYIKTSKVTEVEQLFKVLNFIQNKSYNQERELLDFITRSLNTDRKIPDFLSLLLILKSYNYPDTKYYIYKLLNPDIQQYELKTFGEIAYKANKLDDFLSELEDYRIKELEKYKKIGRPDWNKRWLEERYVSFLLNCFKYPGLEHEISISMKYLESLEDYPEEKFRFLKILLDIRNKHYEGAEIKAYQLLSLFKSEDDLKWDNDFFKIWVLSRLLFKLNQGSEINPTQFFQEIDQLIDFDKMKKQPIYFRVFMLDVLNHELLEEFKNEILNFAKNLFFKIVQSIDWNDKTSHNIIMEKIYFNRDIICQFPVKAIKSLDKLNENLIIDKFNQTRKNYLHYIKAMIYLNNNQKQKAEEILKNFLTNINDREIYTVYEDIIDLYIELVS